MTPYHLVATIGLICDIAGATVLSFGLFVTKERAVELSVARFSNKELESNLKQPQVRDRLKQSRFAKFGLALLVIGFLLQMAAVWIN